ncbi:MAG: succinylglutamate desuccinylase [Alphaproteobacteria bacterium]|nr:succinylglutamate desuccinylase [Alphaproteobacteria bacterium]
MTEKPPTAPAIELTPPDIEPYRSGNTGVPYVTTFDSGKIGPHAMICAIIHGNELCGAIALDQLFQRDIRPQRGRFTLVFANPDAYDQFDPTHPTASRFVDEDLNRVWSPEVLAGSRASLELERARALRPIVDTVDTLLDLHSMQSNGAPLILSGPSTKGRNLAATLASPAVIVADSGHSAGTRLRDYGAFSDPDDGRNALLVECGQHWRADTAAVAVDTAYRFLVRLGMVDLDDAASHLLPAPAVPERWIDVTDAINMNHDDCRFSDDYAGLQVIPAAGTLIAMDGDREIRTPYDDCVLVMPARRLAPGQTAVRLGRYVEMPVTDGN